MDKLFEIKTNPPMPPHDIVSLVQFGDMTKQEFLDHCEKVIPELLKSKKLGDGIEFDQIQVVGTVNGVELKQLRFIKYKKETGLELISRERKEQIEKHGVTVEDDVNHNDKGQLINAAQKLILEGDLSNAILYNPPPNWGRSHWIRMCKKSYKERLIIAGALIAAEIDRLQNTEKDGKGNRE